MILYTDLLPANWTTISRAWTGTTLDAAWGRAAACLLQHFGEPALAVRDVGRVVEMATGFSPDGQLRAHAWLATIPDASWAVSTAWGERIRGGRYSPGDLWSAAQEIRAIDMELDVLGAFASAGLELIPDSRAQGAPDWRMRHHGQELFVEVKSKGEQGEALDFLHAALVGMQLLERRGTLRNFRWQVDAPGHEAPLATSLREGSFHGAVDVMFQARERISEWLRNDPDTSDTLTLVVDRGRQVEAHWYGGIFSLAPLAGRAQSPLLIYGDHDADRLWHFNQYRSEADWEPGRLDHATVMRIATLLDRLLLRGGTERGRQMGRFPENTIYVLRWPAPFSWDSALAQYPEDITDILATLTSAAELHRPRPAIAIWASAFSKTARTIFLNVHAQALLGVERLVDARPRA